MSHRDDILVEGPPFREGPGTGLETLKMSLAPAARAKDSPYRGRPRLVGTKTARRRLMVRVVFLYLSGALRAEEAAASARVSRRTITRWCRVLLADGEPDTDGLRRLVALRSG